MGRPAIEALNLVSRVNMVNGSDQRWVDKYAHLFQGLGTMEEEYHVKLRDDAIPFAQTTPRCVALPLMTKVKAELERMEQLSVIYHVEEATDWCAPMVVVPKPDGNVQICVDLTKLNPFLPEFIIPAEPLNARDKMAAPERYPKRARNTTSSVFFRPKG